MVTSSDFVRWATHAASLSDTAFDALREAVLVVDSRATNLPILLANATARRCILGDSDSTDLIGASLTSLLESVTEAVLQAVLGAGTFAKVSTNRVLTWRLARGESPLTTELKPLASAPNQHLVMLTFAEPKVESDLLSALEQLPFDLLILDRELTVTYANTGAWRTAGSMIGGLLGQDAKALTPTVALPRNLLLNALNGVHYHTDALELKTANGVSRWFEVDLQPLKGAAGIVSVAVLSSEISKHGLRLNDPRDDLRLIALTEHARDIISVAGRDGQLHFVSGGVRNSLGYTTDERRSNSLFQHVHPDDVSALRARYAQLVAGEVASFSHQFRVKHKDGTYRWLESSYTAALDNRLIDGVVVNSRDITERKLAESRLAQREEVFRLAADAVDGVVFEWDLAQGVVHRSRGVLEVLGIEPEDLAPGMDAWCERIHPRDFSAFRKKISLALIDGRGWTATYRIRDARGRYRSMLERGVIQRDAGGDPVRAIGCAVDVSQVKRLTDLLTETHRTAKMGGWEYTYAASELTWTDEMFRIYGKSPANFVVSWESMLGCCTAESRKRFVDARVLAESRGGDVDLELEIDVSRTERLWIRVIGHWENLHGRSFRAFGSVQNIQAQKLAQIALENSTRWLKLSMGMAHMHAWRWEKAGDKLEFAIVDGQDASQLTALAGLRHLLARVHPRERTAMTRAIERALETRQEVQHEFRLKMPDGRYRSYAAVARPVFDASEAPQGLVGVTQDVTARREGEARLRRSEELLRATTANTADTLLLVDSHLQIRFINRAVGERSIEQIIGHEISVVLPLAVRGRVIEKLRKVLRTGKAATYEFHIVEAGEIAYFEYRAVRMQDSGIGTGLSITVRNVTERKRLEQEILDVSSRERHTIGRDLHDGLGQELTGIALMLRGLATRIQQRCPDVVDNVNEVVTLVNQSIESARSLARGLLPVRTDNGGLPFALKTLAARSRDVYGLDVTFASDIRPGLSFSEASASHLFRIAQEALTNASRHGGADLVSIYLSVTRQNFVLKITDNGVGIGESARSAPGMGLKIMKYRASMIGAKFDIAPHTPRGTVVNVMGEQPGVTSTLQSAHAI